MNKFTLAKIQTANHKLKILKGDIVEFFDYHSNKVLTVNLIDSFETPILRDEVKACITATSLSLAYHYNGRDVVEKFELFNKGFKATYEISANSVGIFKLDAKTKVEKIFGKQEFKNPTVKYMTNLDGLLSATSSSKHFSKIFNRGKSVFEIYFYL